MIQFFIEDREVILPDNFKFTFIENNPEINSEGDLTLDITVSLRNHQNQKAFKFMNRAAVTDKIVSTDGRLIENGITRFGTIYISSCTNTEVTFQFLAGNSELNFISKTEGKIWKLDWGSIPELNLSIAINSVNNWSVSNGFVCTPVKAGEQIVNEFKLDFSSITDDLIVPQPFLLYYVNKLPELFGYKMKSSVLDSDPRAQRMFIVNSVQSLNYADYLPDMTISEFVKSIEDFFNVTFLANSKDNTISVIRTIDDISSKRRVNMLPINGFKNEGSDDDTGFKFGYTKIKYNLTSNEYFKFHQISDEILSKTEIVIPDWGLTLSEIAEQYITNNGKHKIFRILDSGGEQNDWIYSETNYDSFPGTYLELGGTPYLYVYNVNEFRSYGDSDDKTLLLNIVPSEITRSSQQYLSSGSGPTKYVSYLIPVSSNDYQFPTDLSVFDQIAGQSDELNRSNVLEVSIYMGRARMKVSVDGTISNYPFSNNDYPYWKFAGVGSDYGLVDLIPEIKNLRIVGDNGIVENYRHQNIIDTSYVYTFYFDDNVKYTVDCLYYCDDAWYLPISLERLKTNKSSSSLVKGKFYKLK